MSNFLAIATATATLRDLLQETAMTDVQDHDVTVTMVRPDAIVTNTQEARINIYLYQVTPNASWRNVDLPTRRVDGTLIQRPKVALDLHYMISFYGDENQLVSQRLLGSVVRTLHAQPQLARERIRHTIAPAGTDDSRIFPNFPFLRSSTLAEDIELVKFSPLHLSLEELSKIWSVFYQIPYTLSVAYQGTFVLIETDDTPQSTLPVRTRNIYAVPFNQPTIQEVRSASGANQPILPKDTLIILGNQLRGSKTLVRLGGNDIAPDSKNVTDKQITLPLPATLAAGIQGVQIIQPFPMGTPKTDHAGVESNAVPFVLRPVLQKKGDGTYDIAITNVVGTGTALRAADVTIKLQPVVGKQQRVVLQLNQVSPDRTATLDNPARYSFVAPLRNQLDAPDTTDTITIPVAGVRAGAYVVRVQVDGAESLLDIDMDPKSPTFNLYMRSPQVTLP
ncbi:MAG: DUF4255 domain-containing protein [Ktedonobacteraceae bacterium]